ncbi:MAG: hypothetical protein ABI658_15700 [Acidimicrobiales bacterium]
MRQLTPAELDAYDVLPRALASRVRVQRVPFLAPGSSGMTVGRFVFVRNDGLLDGSRKIIAHELVHVRQYYELGLLRFLARYLKGYVRALAKLRRHRAAYLAIPFEEQAYAEADAWLVRRQAID